MTREEFREYYLSCDDKELVMETAKEIKADGVPISIEEIENRIRIKRSKAQEERYEAVQDIPQPASVEVPVSKEIPVPEAASASETVPAPETAPVPKAVSVSKAVPEASPAPPAGAYGNPAREPGYNAPPAPKRKRPGKLPSKNSLIILPLVAILITASFFGIRALSQYIEEKAESGKQAESYDEQSQKNGEWVGISDDISYKAPDGYKESGKSDKYIRLTNGEDTIIIQKSKHYDGSFDYYIGEYNAAPAKAGQYSGYEYTKESEYFFMFENDNCDYTISSNKEADCKQLIESISFTQGEQNND